MECIYVKIGDSVVLFTMPEGYKYTSQGLILHLQETFPNATISRMDIESVSSVDDLEESIQSFINFT